MSDPIIVINEWIVHDINGDNGTEGRLFATNFLEKLLDKTCQIVYHPDTPWAKKVYALMKNKDVRVKGISKMLVSIIFDSNKCIFLHGTIDEDDEDLTFLKDTVPAEDRYLVVMSIKAKADYLVTTDTELKEAVNRLNELGKVRLRAIDKTEFYSNIL